MRNRSAFDPRANEFLFDYSVSIRFFHSQFPSRKKRFLVLWNLFVGITTRSIFTWKLFSSRGRRRNDGYFDKFDIEQCTVKMSMHERTRLLDTIAENTVDTAENFKCAIH